jgi:two-component system copper resistance phosphate regulon response regulator CusR
MLKLFLIDDDEELCAELAEVLEAEGFKVDTALDGLQGLRRLQEKQYQMIILDLKLPGLNGYGVLKGIRRTVKPLKVLVLSGRPLGEPLLKEDGVSQDEEEKVLNMADFVINKPFMVDNLIQKVKELAGSVVEKGQ